jgi:hypothetical protein
MLKSMITFVVICDIHDYMTLYSNKTHCFYLGIYDYIDATENIFLGGGSGGCLSSHIVKHVNIVMYDSSVNSSM